MAEGTVMELRAHVERNLEWFRASGVMRPADGFWGVAERLVIAPDNEALARINRVFTVQTRLTDAVFALEHRRADCAFEIAYLFDLAAEVLGRPADRAVADTLLDYLLHRSGLHVAKPEHPARGLWGWSNPLNMQSYWTDDNAWVATLALALAARGREELRETGVSAARALCAQLRRYLDYLREHGKDAVRPSDIMVGLYLNPHWFGLVTMALAWAATADAETDYAGPVRDYYRLVLDGPPAWDEHSRGKSTGLPWTLSEYAYLALCGSIAAAVFPGEEVRAAARGAADLLVQYQQPEGHFFAEHHEAPEGAHLVDLVYTQNWATLGLYHAWLVFDRDPRYRQAFDRSLALLADLQDGGDAPVFRGCWRGMYDMRARAWGGGDRYEGGQNSLYSGWTNAPISWAFLFAMSGHSLLPPAVASRGERA